MPLPTALLKRLANRGIVQSNKLPTVTAEPAAAAAVAATTTEEIIAEDYDEVEDPSQYDYESAATAAAAKKSRHSNNFWVERMKRRVGETNLTGYKGCPNKYNIYHKCTVYCINRWADGILEPKRSYLRRRQRLVRKYPLPKTWLEIYDYGCAVHYYWNTTDDTVSWLPPGHPKSAIGKSAATLRREMEETTPAPEMMDADQDDGGDQMALEIQKLLDESLTPTAVSGSSRTQRRSTPSPEPMAPPPVVIKKTKSRDLDKALRHKQGRRLRAIRPGGGGADDPLDPMDPAAYSDIPRGKWSDGLIEGGSAKSGVDPTASGALFQMRPYPSPGAVLQSNANNAAPAAATDRRRSSPLRDV